MAGVLDPWIVKPIAMNRGRGIKIYKNAKPICNELLDGRDLEIIEQTDVLDVLTQRKDQGDIGLVGFSGKTLEGHRALLGPTPKVDVLMIELNPLETDQAPLLFEADRCGVGLLIKKGLASGRLSASEALPWLLAHEEIGSIVVGGLSLQNVRENVSRARR